jgi:hypothetical protein
MPVNLHLGVLLGVRNFALLEYCAFPEVSLVCHAKQDVETDAPQPWIESSMLASKFLGGRCSVTVPCFGRGSFYSDRRFL